MRFFFSFEQKEHFELSLSSLMMVLCYTGTLLKMGQLNILSFFFFKAENKLLNCAIEKCIQIINFHLSYLKEKNHTELNKRHLKCRADFIIDNRLYATFL